MEARGQENAEAIAALGRRLDGVVVDPTASKADTIRLQGNMETLKVSWGLLEGRTFTQD